MREIELYTLLKLAQEHIANNYASALVDDSKHTELKAYIAKYLYDTEYTVQGYRSVTA